MARRQRTAIAALLPYKVASRPTTEGGGQPSTSSSRSGREDAEPLSRLSSWTLMQVSVGRAIYGPCISSFARLARLAAAARSQDGCLRLRWQGPHGRAGKRRNAAALGQGGRRAKACYGVNGPTQRARHLLDTRRRRKGPTGMGRAIRANYGRLHTGPGPGMEPQGRNLSRCGRDLAQMRAVGSHVHRALIDRNQVSERPGRIKRKCRFTCRQIEQDRCPCAG